MVFCPSLNSWNSNSPCRKLSAFDRLAATARRPGGQKLCRSAIRRSERAGGGPPPARSAQCLQARRRWGAPLAARLLFAAHARAPGKGLCCECRRGLYSPGQRVPQEEFICLFHSPRDTPSRLNQPFDMLPVAAALAACGRATSRAAGRRLGARGDWLVARRREIPIQSRLVRGEGPFFRRVEARQRAQRRQEACLREGVEDVECRAL